MIVLERVSKVAVGWDAQSIAGAPIALGVEDVGGWECEGVRYRVYDYEDAMYEFLAADVFALVDDGQA